MSLEGPLFCHLIKKVCWFLGDCSKCHHNEGKPVQLSALQEQRQFTLPFVMTGQGCITTLNTENIHFHFKSLKDLFSYITHKVGTCLQKRVTSQVGHGTTPEWMYLRQWWQAGVATPPRLSFPPPAAEMPTFEPRLKQLTMGFSWKSTSPTSMSRLATTWRPKRGSYLTVSLESKQRCNLFWYLGCQLCRSVTLDLPSRCCRIFRMGIFELSPLGHVLRRCKLRWRWRILFNWLS